MTQALIDVPARVGPAPTAAREAGRQGEGAAAAFGATLDQTLNSADTADGRAGGTADDRASEATRSRHESHGRSARPHDGAGDDAAAANDDDARTLLWAVSTHPVQTPYAAAAGVSDASAERHRNRPPAAPIRPVADAQTSDAAAHRRATAAGDMHPAAQPPPGRTTAREALTAAGRAATGTAATGNAAAPLSAAAPPQATTHRRPDNAPNNAAGSIANTGASASSDAGSHAPRTGSIPAPATPAGGARVVPTAPRPASSAAPSAAPQVASPGALSAVAPTAPPATAARSATAAATHRDRQRPTAATDAAARATSPTAVHLPATATLTHAAPVAAPTPPTPTPLSQPDLAGTLARLRTAADGTYQMRVSVHPAELGGVNVVATVHHGVLSVLLSPDPTAHHAISQALPQLRAHLADQGFVGVDVGLGSPQNGSGQPGEQGPHAHGSGHSTAPSSGNAVDRIGDGAGDSVGATTLSVRYRSDHTILDRLL